MVNGEIVKCYFKWFWLHCDTITVIIQKMIAVLGRTVRVIFFSSWTLFKLTGRTWQNVFILSSLARKVLGHDNFSHGFLIEESHQS
jgi:hypothetical protein